MEKGWVWKGFEFLGRFGGKVRVLGKGLVNGVDFKYSVCKFCAINKVVVLDLFLSTFENGVKLKFF